MGLCHMPDCPSEDACKHAEYAACLASLCSCGYACSRVDLQPMSHCMPIALQPATPPCNGFGLIEASLCLHHAKSCTPQHFCKSGIMPNHAHHHLQIWHHAKSGIMPNYAHHDMFANLASCQSGTMPNLASCQIMHTTTYLHVWHHIQGPQSLKAQSSEACTQLIIAAESHNHLRHVHD